MTQATQHTKTVEVLTAHFIHRSGQLRARPELANALKDALRRQDFICLDVFATTVQAGKPSEARSAMWERYDKAKVRTPNAQDAREGVAATDDTVGTPGVQERARQAGRGNGCPGAGRTREVAKPQRR